MFGGAAVDDGEEEVNMELREPSKDCPVCEETGLPLDLPVECLISVLECDSHDPVDRMVAFQKHMELVHEMGSKMRAAAQTRARATAEASAAAVG